MRDAQLHRPRGEEGEREILSLSLCGTPNYIAPEVSTFTVGAEGPSLRPLSLAERGILSLSLCGTPNYIAPEVNTSMSCETHSALFVCWKHSQLRRPTTSPPRCRGAPPMGRVSNL